MERDRTVDRFLTFADAVVAIAITLLALPLLELAGEASEGPAAWWSAAALPLLGLVVSFAVIARLWLAHHHVYVHVVRLNTPLLVITFVWLLTIVLVAIATAITTSADPVGGERDGRWAFALYVGVMMLSGTALLAQAVVVLRRPSLTDGQDGDALARVVGSAETLVGFGLALVIGLLVPQINYFAFAVLALTGRVDRWIMRRIERRRDRRGVSGG